jgi:hypothetical protein
MDLKESMQNKLIPLLIPLLLYFLHSFMNARHVCEEVSVIYNPGVHMDLLKKKIRSF